MNQAQAGRRHTSAPRQDVQLHRQLSSMPYRRCRVRRRSCLGPPKSSERSTWQVHAEHELEFNDGADESNERAWDAALTREKIARYTASKLVSAAGGASSRRSRPPIKVAQAIRHEAPCAGPTTRNIILDGQPAHRQPGN